MVGQHEHRRVEDGVVAPPALPVEVLPRPALRPELVAAHDLGAEPKVDAFGEQSNATAVRLEPGDEARDLAVLREFYADLGAKVTVVEMLDRIVPVEDADGVIDFYLEMAANPEVGIGGSWHPSPYSHKGIVPDSPLYVLRQMDVAVRDGRIAFAGPLDGARAALPGARMVNLQGRTMLPGFIDTWGHFLLFAQQTLGVNLAYFSDDPPRNKADIIRLLRGATPFNGWITGYGYSETLLSDGQPTLADLDAARRRAQGGVIRLDDNADGAVSTVPSTLTP